MMQSLANIEWQSVWLLALIPLVCCLFYYHTYRLKTESSAIKFPYIGASFNFQNWKMKFIKVPKYLKLFSIICVLIAIAGPRKALVNQSVSGNGIDIVLALDISASMLTQDFKPNRLEISKKMAIDFVNKRIEDRIGLVVFSGEAFTQCPLTVDHEILNDFIEQQQVGYLEDGTAIGMGLATAVNRIKNSDAKSKIVILLTDGKNNKGYIDPHTAMQLAKELNVKVYTIGVGSDEPAIGPVSRSFSGELIYDYVKGEIDETLLRQIAENTNGKYFRAKDELELDEIYNEIDSLEKSTIETAVLKRYRELFRIPVLIGMVLLMCAVVLENTYFRKFPV